MTTAADSRDASASLFVWPVPCTSSSSLLLREASPPPPRAVPLLRQSHASLYLPLCLCLWLARSLARSLASRFASFRLASLRLASPRRAAPRRASPHRHSPQLASPRFDSPRTAFALPRRAGSHAYILILSSFSAVQFVSSLVSIFSAFRFFSQPSCTIPPISIALSYESQVSSYPR